jgi:hypothetical protein
VRVRIIDNVGKKDPKCVSIYNKKEEAETLHPTGIEHVRPWIRVGKLRGMQFWQTRSNGDARTSRPCAAPKQFYAFVKSSGFDMCEDIVQLDDSDPIGLLGYEVYVAPEDVWTVVVESKDCLPDAELQEISTPPTPPLGWRNFE